jgi:MoaA/NifB/PqqE/SkfB family radical SAM enzyme
VERDPRIDVTAGAQPATSGGNDWFTGGAMSDVSTVAGHSGSGHASASRVSIVLPEDEMQIKFAPDETIVFASSSGHCNLDCTYCIISPVVKLQPSLTYEDLCFLHERIGGKVFFIFSGKGDFFAGYPKSERLLARLLERDDIGVALDINGVVIHCFDSLGPAQLRKIRHINLTFHYQQLKGHKALRVWRQNALTMLRKADSEDFFLNFILSPPESGIWEEALAWFEQNIHADYPKKLILINDVNLPLTAVEERLIARLHERFGHVIQSVRRGNFESVLKEFDHVSCPAGQTYFRVWNDGRIEGCPNVDGLKHAGNAKERVFLPRSEAYICNDVRHCDCYHIASAGKMVFHRTVPVRPAPPAAPAARSVVAWLRDLRLR